jgi:hypothetical protein
MSSNFICSYMARNSLTYILGLEWRAGLSDTILKGTHPGTIPARFGLIWFSGFRGEDFFNISQSETRIALGGHICWQNGTK